LPSKKGMSYVTYPVRERVKIHTDTKKKPQVSVTFRDNDIRVLRFFCQKNV
jgi:hypothetical protein